ncbi:hypothetical protein [Burkholderia glumae]|uniref:hypothetical protein n=1 Tax=Burkholderia glumae TaxID=337 RepID=UPI0003A53895|nr:hypothetical protein [Burkholderia glumae]MCM2490740.1 hypothetical protein [Burkholderia glumae]MCM2544796.1 hypothetical protein [Burkholderia glumae]PJO23917.1 hypothetical protein Y5A_006670 [Burkholderia glumae AU6208]QHE11310.1 hypothetical protein GQR88_13400 [Burkholderia glumae AU6208]
MYHQTGSNDREKPLVLRTNICSFYFDIFKALFEHVMTINHLEIEILFKKIPAGAHFCACGLLKSALEEAYRQQAARDIFSTLLLVKRDDALALASGLSEKVDSIRDLVRHIRG